MRRKCHRHRGNWRGIFVFLSMGFLLVPEIYGQGMEGEEWRSRFQETLRVGTKDLPAFVLRRLKNLFADMEQNGLSQGLDPSMLANKAATLARHFDEDLRRGASPVLAGLLYRQMSRSLSLEKEGGKENRDLAFEKLRDRVKDRNWGKEKDRTRLSGLKRKPGFSSTPQELPTGGSSGSGGSGGK